MINPIKEIKMKNLKILIIAAVIGLASVGCADNGGKKKKTTDAPLTTEQLITDAADLAADARDLANSASDDADLSAAADALVAAADAVALADDNNLSAALAAFISATENFISAVEVAASNDPTLSSSAIDFSILAADFSDNVASLDLTEELVEELPAEAPVVEELPAEAPVVEAPVVAPTPEPTVEIPVVEEETPVAEEPVEETPEVPEVVLTDVAYQLEENEVCPADTETEHFVCTAFDKYAFLKVGTISFLYDGSNGLIVRYETFGPFGAIQWEVSYTETVDGTDLYEIHNGDTSVSEFSFDYVETLVSSGATIEKFSDRLEVTTTEGDLITLSIDSVYSTWLD